MREQRTVVWFSCGAASAAAAAITLKQATTPVEVVYCDTSADEHPDNMRFMTDVERWLGTSVQKIRSKKYGSVNDVFMKRRYMSGVGGALCTVEMKKIPRFAFQRPDDIHVFGYTVDEQERATRFSENNPELILAWPLIDNGIDKDMAKQMLIEAGIELPALYQQGFQNNNCIGCVKATSARYWNRVRQFYPDVFELRAKQSRELNVQLTRIAGERVFLDELPATADGPEENISCGPECAPPVQLGMMDGDAAIGVTR